MNLPVFCACGKIVEVVYQTTTTTGACEACYVERHLKLGVPHLRPQSVNLRDTHALPIPHRNLGRPSPNKGKSRPSPRRGVKGTWAERKLAAREVAK